MKNVIYHILLGVLCIDLGNTRRTYYLADSEQVGKSAPRHLFFLLGCIHCSIPHYGFILELRQLS